MATLIRIILALFAFSSTCAQAGLIGVTDLTGSDAGRFAAIISAPLSVTNRTVSNFAQQGFNEAQNVMLRSAIDVDGGSIAAGTRVSSHMIFLNKPDYINRSRIIHFGVDWLFDGRILGVMSDFRGELEVASTSILGAPATNYTPSPFRGRGIEFNDSYNVAGNRLTVNMRVIEPGDWIRVITAANISPRITALRATANVPEPGMLGVLALGLISLGFQNRKKMVAC